MSELPQNVTPSADTLFSLPPQGFDVLCPMHLVLDATGHVRHAGPTLQKLRPDRSLVGARFFELFQLTQPQAVDGMVGLLAVAGQPLRLKLRDTPRTPFKGVVVPLTPDARGRQGAVVSLSFGIYFSEALQSYPLHSGDFAPTDLIMEMLFLVEANGSVSDAYRRLSQRLQGDKILAEEQAYTDTLTGLKNRRALDHVLARTLRGGQSFALTHLDLDYFKAVNDTHGHAAGDHVLQQVAKIMLEETREADTVARVGGDEFVLLFPRLTRADRIEEIARRLVRRLEEPIPFEGIEARISCSMGTTLSTYYDAPGADAMLADADRALYLSKKLGRAQHNFFDPNLD